MRVTPVILNDSDAGRKRALEAPTIQQQSYEAASSEVNCSPRNILLRQEVEQLRAQNAAGEGLEFCRSVFPAHRPVYLQSSWELLFDVDYSTTPENCYRSKGTTAIPK